MNRIPVAERSKATVCGRSLTGISGSNPAEGMDVCVLCVLYSKDKRESKDKEVQRQKTKIPVGVRFFAPIKNGPGAHPASYTIGTGSISRG